MIFYMFYSQGILKEKFGEKEGIKDLHWGIRGREPVCLVARSLGRCTACPRTQRLPALI